MAKTYLESTDSNFRVVNNNTTIIGTTALNDRVVIDEGITGINLGSTVEKVDFAGSLSAYQFKQGFGSAVDVYLNSVKIASITSVADKYFVFSDGSAALSYTLGKVGIGGKDITTSIAGVTGATLNTAEVSLSTSSNGSHTVTISAAGTTVATAAADMFNINTSTTYSNTITGFDVTKDKLSLGTGVAATAINIINTADDGSASFTYSKDSGVHTVTITLTGLTSAQDTSLTTVDGWNAIWA